MKIHQLILSLFLIILLTACSNENERPQAHLGEIFSIALDSIMEKDAALSSDMEFIAIDMSNYNELSGQEITEQDKREIIHYFEAKYEVKIMDATYEKIREQGLYDKNTLVLDGVLLQLEHVEIKSNLIHNEVGFEGSKYRAGDGAVGVEVIVHFNDNMWEVKESEETWIS